MLFDADLRGLHDKRAMHDFLWLIGSVLIGGVRSGIGYRDSLWSRLISKSPILAVLKAARQCLLATRFYVRSFVMRLGALRTASPSNQVSADFVTRLPPFLSGEQTLGAAALGTCRQKTGNSGNVG